MGANPFVVSTPSINSYMIVTSVLSFLFDAVQWSVGEYVFGCLGDFAVLLLTALVYRADLAVEFDTAGDTPFTFLLRTVVHVESFP